MSGNQDILPIKINPVSNIETSLSLKRNQNEKETYWKTNKCNS